jgi:tRNA pseudouridine55 synthase
VSESPAPAGLLLVDKPPGPTSHDVVNRIRRVLAMRRVGHSGTLDPAASGLLLIGFGRATRLMTFLQGLPKTYRAVMRFGVTTNSGDAEGEIQTEGGPAVTRSEVEGAASTLTGEITQLPPMFSAVKIGGVPLYRSARRGEDVERPSRTVRIYQLDLEEFDEGAQTATFFVKCSSGTYIRTLAVDLGEKLGSGAHLTGLRRLSIDGHSVEQATPLTELELLTAPQAISRSLSMRQAMRDFPQISVDGQQLEAVGHGRVLERPELLEPPRRIGELSLIMVKKPGDRPAHEAGMTAGIPVAIIDPSGELIAVYRRTSKGLRPAAVLK